MADHEEWRLGYRPELDGLRGVAIAMVLCMHATGYMRGSLGVIIFFVLSGFLITSLLLEEREKTGRVRLPAFYWRRAVRLLPALFVTLAVVGAWMVASGDGGRIMEQFTPALLYFMNWVAMDGPVGSVGHTWSLAIEEQFYIVWPMVLLGAMSFGGRPFAFAVVSGGVALSVILRFALAEEAATGRSFYGSDTNAFALLLGCGLAILMTGGWRPAIPRWLSVASAVALGLVFTVNQSELHALTFGDTMGAVAATVAIAALVTMPVRHPILSARPFVALGRISYGLYLVNIPIRTAVETLPETVPAWASAMLIIGLSVAAAVAMWAAVERPAVRLRDATSVLALAKIRQARRRLQPMAGYPRPTHEAPIEVEEPTSRFPSAPDGARY